MRRPTACVELDRARRAGPSPRGEQRRRCPPKPDAAPLPCGSAPFETHRGSHLCGSRCRDVISPSEGVHAVSAQQHGFGLGVASGPQVSVALRALRPVAPPDALRLLWRIVLRKGGRKAPLNQCCGGVPASWGGPVKRESRSIRPAAAPFLTPPKWNATALRQWGQRTTMKETPRTRSPGERATHPWLLTLTSLIVILLLSLGLWWAVWKLASP